MSLGILVTYDLKTIQGRDVHKEYKDRMINSYGYSKAIKGDSRSVNLPNTTLIKAGDKQTTEQGCKDMEACAKDLKITLEKYIALRFDAWMANDPL